MSQPTTSILLNSTAPAAPTGNQNCVPATDGATPLQSITLAPQKATSSLLGVVKPDGTSITVDGTGKLSTVAIPAPTTPVPVIRGSSQEVTASGADTLTIALPTGSLAGDMCLLFVGFGYAVNPITGWAAVYSSLGTTVDSAAFWKILTSGDITAGSVTATSPGVGFGGGGYWGLASMVTFVGPTAGVREAEGNTGAGSGPQTVSTTSGVQLGDIGVAWGWARGGSSVGVASVTPGAALQTLASSTDPYGVMSDAAMPGGVTTFTFTYSTGEGAGSQQIVVIVEGITPAVLPPTGVTPGSYTNANITVGADGRLSAASSDLEGATASLGGSSIAAGATVSRTVTLTGAVVGQKVVVNASDGSLPNPLIILSAAVTAANTVTVQLAAIATVTPTAKTYNVVVLP